MLVAYLSGKTGMHRVCAKSDLHGQTRVGCWAARNSKLKSTEQQGKALHFHNGKYRGGVGYRMGLIQHYERKRAVTHGSCNRQGIFAAVPKKFSCRLYCLN